MPLSRQGRPLPSAPRTDPREQLSRTWPLHGEVDTWPWMVLRGLVIILGQLRGARPGRIVLLAAHTKPSPPKAKVMASVNVEIVKRSDAAKGFVVLPKRWVVKRTFVRLGRYRRLSKDRECLNRKGLAFLRLASIRLMRANAVATLFAPARRPASTLRHVSGHDPLLLLLIIKIAIHGCVTSHHPDY